MENERKTINNKEYGMPICQYEGIFPMQIACNRIDMFANGNASYCKHYFNGNNIIEELKLDEKTYDIYKKISVSNYAQNYDSYEVLLCESKDTRSVDGTYLAFRVFNQPNGDVKFDDIAYRHCENGKTIYLRGYTDDDISRMITEVPEHPMIVLMTKTLNKFNENFSFENSSLSSANAQPNL